MLLLFYYFFFLIQSTARIYRLYQDMFVVLFFKIYFPVCVQFFHRKSRSRFSYFKSIFRTHFETVRHRWGGRFIIFLHFRCYFLNNRRELVGRGTMSFNLIVIIRHRIHICTKTV